MHDTNRALVERIMSLPILQAEWVLWLLFALSLLSLAIVLERLWFFGRRRADMDRLRRTLTAALQQGALLEGELPFADDDSLEANVARRGLAAAARGPDAVEEVLRSALSAASSSTGSQRMRPSMYSIT